MTLSTVFDIPAARHRRRSETRWVCCLMLLLSLSIVRVHAQPGLREAYLVGPGTGYALMGNKLLRRENNGKQWSTVTPPLGANQSIWTSFFIDGKLGWSVLASSGPGNISAVSTSITRDGGWTWIKGSAVPVRSQMLEGLAGNAYLTFLDEHHGWLELQLVSSSNFKLGFLFGTNDRGMTWSELPRPPIVDRIKFISPMVGWIVGGPGNDDLESTRDGGKTWKRESVKAPQAALGSTTTFYSLPQFDSYHRGYLPVTFFNPPSAPNKSVFAIYTSLDDGASWEQATVQPDTLVGQPDISLTDLGVISAYVQDGQLSTQRRASGATAVSEATVTTSRIQVSKKFPALVPFNSFSLLSQTFVSPSNGWYVILATSSQRLFATEDAGKSVTDITPVADVP